MSRWPVRSVAERFWSHVERRGPDECWPWLAAKSSWGYGRMTVGLGKDQKRASSHRIAYEISVGPIPNGLEIDHLCRNPACVNPAHLEPVTQAENIRRVSRLVVRCARGHAYDEANTYVRPTGWRDCRTCIRERQRRSTARRSAA